MQYAYLKVNPKLSGLIRTVLVLDHTLKKEKNKLPLFTNGTPVLLCRTEPGNVSQLCLFGNSAPAEQWEIEKQQTLIAYFFKPFSISSLFNIPANELANDRIELSHWDPHKSHALKTQLLFAQNNSERISVLDNFLCMQLKMQEKECHIVQYATDAIIFSPGKEVLSEILHDLKLNERTFQRIFRKYVGITATQYRKICQLKASFDKLKSGQFNTLTDVAYETGFTDQSHFIRSFREHIQTTPKIYVKSGLRKK